MILSENTGTPKLQFEWADDGKTWNFWIPYFSEKAWDYELMNPKVWDEWSSYLFITAGIIFIEDGDSRKIGVDDQQELGDQLSKVRDIELTKAIIGVAESRCKIGCRSLSAGIEQPTTWTFRLFGFSHKDCHASDDLVCIYSTEIVCPVPKYYMDRIKRWYSVGICIQHLSLSLTLSLSLSLSLSLVIIYTYMIYVTYYMYIYHISYIYISYIVYIYISYILYLTL